MPCSMMFRRKGHVNVVARHSCIRLISPRPGAARGEGSGGEGLDEFANRLMFVTHAGLAFSVLRSLGERTEIM